jgi:hypothetical protein
MRQHPSLTQLRGPRGRHRSGPQFPLRRALRTPIALFGTSPSNTLRLAHLSTPTRQSVLSPLLPPFHTGWAARHLASDCTNADKAATPSPAPALPQLSTTLPIILCSTQANRYHCAYAYRPPPLIGRASDISPSALCARINLRRPASIRHTSHSSASPHPRPHTKFHSPSVHSSCRSSEFFHRYACHCPPLPLDLVAHVDNHTQHILLPFSRS